MSKLFIFLQMRSIWKNKVFFISRTSGLILGFSAFVLVTFWINQEINVDKFHSNCENIYRVTYNLYEEGVLELSSAAAVPPIGLAMKNDYPEIKDFTRFIKTSGIVSRGEVKFKELDMLYAESSFFDIFSYPLVEGTKDSTILNINQMVITQKAAERYFGNKSPIGQTLTLNGNSKYTISGVVANPTKNSHFNFDFLISMKNLEKRFRGFNNAWYFARCYTYVVLDKNSNPRKIEDKITRLVEKHQGERMKAALFLREFKLQRLTDIHLKSNLSNEFKANGNLNSVVFLSIIAIALMLISILNYVNLSFSKWIEKLGETNIKQIIGGTRRHIILQTTTEAIIAILFSIIVSITPVVVLLPPFNNMMGIKLDFDIQLITSIALLLLLLGIVVGGIAPGYYLHKIVLHGRVTGKSAKGNSQYKSTRNVLVVSQFAVSIVLIIGTITVYSQLSFMQNKDLGINIDQIMVIESPRLTNDSIFQQKMTVLKSQKSSYPFVKNMTSSTTVPGKEITFNRAIGKIVAGINTEKNTKFIGVDKDFLETYGLKLFAGHNFTETQPGDIQNILINQSAVKYFDLYSPQEAIGQLLSSNGQRFKIIGVVKDFNQMSLKERPEPLCFVSINRGVFLSIQFNSANTQSVVSAINKFWKSNFPRDMFDYFFLDDSFNAQYESDKRFGMLLYLASIIAIVIACIGLLGLSLQNIIAKIKEIGIRRVNGASVSDILVTINKSFMALVGLSFVIACPIAYYAMNKWLENFAYKTTLSWWIFVLAGMLALGIALLTVSFQSWKAATRNPVEALRYE